LHYARNAFSGLKSIKNVGPPTFRFGPPTLNALAPALFKPYLQTLYNNIVQMLPAVYFLSSTKIVLVIVFILWFLLENSKLLGVISFFLPPASAPLCGVQGAVLP